MVKGFGPRLLDAKGALHVPLFLMTLLIGLSGMGVWGVLRNWRFLVETQLRLDQCVGEVAIEFRDHLNRVQMTNRKIRDLRKAIQLAKVEPYLIPPLEATLGAVVIEQEATLFKWKMTEGNWAMNRGCGKRGDWGLPLPHLDLVRDPPDTIGPQTLRWMGVMPQKFLFLARHSPRAAAARVEGGQIEGEVFSKNWAAFWSSPTKQSFFKKEFWKDSRADAF